MEIKKTQQEEVQVIVDIICDRCGKSTAESHFEVATLSASWGFHSSKDQEAHEAHFCEACFDEILILIGVDADKISV